MREDTKLVINKIIEQWCNNKLYVTVSIDGNDCQIFTVVKNVEKKQMLKRRLTDRFQKDDKKINEDDVICKISVNYFSKPPKAAITFKGPFSIDNDLIETFKYLERFLAVVKTKVRQTNNLGIKVKLGMIDLEEFDRLNSLFTEYKNELISNSKIEEDNYVDRSRRNV